MQKTLSRPVVVVALCLLCNCLWGLGFPAITLGYRALSMDSGDIPSILLFAGLRFMVGAAAILLFGSLFERRPLVPGKGDWHGIVLQAFVQTVAQYVLMYVGLTLTTPVHTAIINGSSVFFAILVTALLFRQEALTGRKLLGCIVGFSGILIMNLDGLSAGGKDVLLGDLLTLAATVTVAFAASITRKYTARTDPLIFGGWQLLIGGAVMAGAGFLLGGRGGFSSPQAWGAFGMLVFITAVADPLWATLLKYNSVSKITVFLLTLPLFGVIMTVLLLGNDGQIFRPATLAAMVLVCLGILAINLPEKAKARRP